MILAGDIGGTKTVLTLYDNGSDSPLHQQRFASADFASLEEILQRFLEQAPARPQAACFGVAGPVLAGEATITNLPWTMAEPELAALLNTPRVKLLNDLEALALAVPALAEEQLLTLNQGEPTEQAPVGVLAPGTGLGYAFLVWNGQGYQACASEGGHASFAPSTSLQLELLSYMLERYDHVSFERLCSGSQLANIYAFLLKKKNMAEPHWLREEMAAARDTTPLIIEYGLNGLAEICQACLDIFVEILATAIGNMAVTLLPRGGIFLGGGLPPRLARRLQQPDFLEAVNRKGRFSALCASIPLHIIMAPQAALQGAACYAFNMVR